MEDVLSQFPSRYLRNRSVLCLRSQCDDCPGVKRWVIHWRRSLAARERFFFSSRRRHTRFDCDWSSDVCSSDLPTFRQCWSTLEIQFLPGSIILLREEPPTFTHPFVLLTVVPPFNAMLNVTVCPQIGRASCRERV